jgi:hypothetical protein
VGCTLESLVDETMKGNYQKVTENFSVSFNRWQWFSLIKGRKDYWAKD